MRTECDGRTDGRTDGENIARQHNTLKEQKGQVNGTGSPLPGSAIPTVGHWGGLGLGLGLGLVMVRVRRTVEMADPGNGGPESK